MLNLNVFFFLHKRFYIIAKSMIKDSKFDDYRTSLFRDVETISAPIVNLPYFNMDYMDEDYILFLNNKLHSFRFTNQESSERIESQNISKLAYLYFVNNNNFDISNMNAVTLLEEACQILTPIDEFDDIVNIRKNWIYKLRKERLLLLKYLFFFKNQKYIEMFVKENKNCLYTIFHNASTLKLISLCSVLGLCYNFESFKKIVLKGIIFLNNKRVWNVYSIVNKNDFVRFCIGEEEIDYFIKSRNYLIENVNLFNSDNLTPEVDDGENYQYRLLDNTILPKNIYSFATNYDSSCIKSIEFSNLSFTAFFFKNINFSSNGQNIFNWTNFRLYSWMIAN